jgi:hypothetical protein
MLRQNISTHWTNFNPVKGFEAQAHKLILAKRIIAKFLTLSVSSDILTVFSRIFK